MLGTRTLRDRSASRDPEADQASQVRNEVKEKPKEKTPQGQWVEPALSQKPSHRDHNGGSYYGVSEHMQPLGEAPNARVKTRVKADGARKSVLGKGLGGVGIDAQETPDGTPTPQTSSHVDVDTDRPMQPRIVVEDEQDADYAPVKSVKKKERAARPRPAKRTSSNAATASNSKSRAPSPPRPVNEVRYDRTKMQNVVECAKRRAIEAGKPDLAAAVGEIYVSSLSNERLTQLLEKILQKTATPDQMTEFQGYVRDAKKRLKADKTRAAAKHSKRNFPEGANGGASSLPLRSPANFTPAESGNTALPSTEEFEPAKLRTSLKTKSTSPEKSYVHENRNRSTSNMDPAQHESLSPRKKRSGSAGSDSSLTDMTSNPDDGMDMDPPGPVDDATGGMTNGHRAKDHAAERGSLAPPNRNLKRSSAEAEVEDEERDRVLATKKQKLSENVTRNTPQQESNLRGSTNASPARVRTLRTNNGKLAPPSLSAPVNGSRRGSTRASRAASAESGSALSSPMSTPSGTPSPPPGLKGTARTFGKKAKTKQSPEKKHQAASSGMPGIGGAGRESPIGDDDNEELSDNQDFCSACGGSGFLLCCDGCDRSFHFSCLDPPLNDDASELNEPWFCFICVAKRPVTSGSPEKAQRGLFAPLLSSLKKSNPSNFALPVDIRDYFEGVATDRNGAFIEAIHPKTRNRLGYDETPDFTKTKDGKGNTILCCYCGKSSQGSRAIIQCDYCGENWHLDCLDPPLANPPARNLEGKKLHDWMCPLHVDHELRRVDTSLLNRRGVGRKVHVRKPRAAKIVETSLRRGHRNNGVIDIVDDESEDDGSDFYDEDSQEESTVYRLPASGIKLDFIDKVKSTRVQQQRSDRAYQKARLAADAPRQLEQANFARRSFVEQQVALNLAQFSKGVGNQDLDLGSDQVETLVGTLIAEAPQAVVDEMMAAEQRQMAAQERKMARLASAAMPPSPPTSEQTEQLSAQQRKELQMLQELIQRRLDGGKT